METLRFVCVPEDHWHTADSVLGTCALCNGGLWISVSGAQALAEVAGESEIETICLNCLDPEEVLEVIPPTPKQLAAIEAQLRRN